MAHRRYMAYTLMMAVAIFPFFSFIGGASDIYITNFGLSKQHFGYFFSFNAFAMMLGFLACTRLLKRIAPNHLITVGYIGTLIGGVLIYRMGGHSPWHLALCMSLMTFLLGMGRPPSNNIVLDQIEYNAGAASSLLVFINMMSGAFGMEVIALNWTNKIQVLGIFATICGGVVLVMWVVAQHLTGSTGK